MANLEKQDISPAKKDEDVISNSGTPKVKGESRLGKDIGRSVINKLVNLLLRGPRIRKLG